MTSYRHKVPTQLPGSIFGCFRGVMGISCDGPFRSTRIRTFSGIDFLPFDPSPDQILIEDVAHALANICRFGGHTRQFYSVAQHSVMVSQLCRPEDALWGLLHDSSEAYLSDIPRPLKSRPEFEAYRWAERNLQRCIAKRFGLAEDQPSSVTVADDQALLIEYRDLMAAGSPIEPMLVRPAPDMQRSVNEAVPPEKAKSEFLCRFEGLVALTLRG